MPVAGGVVAGAVVAGAVVESAAEGAAGAGVTFSAALGALLNTGSNVTVISENNTTARRKTVSRHVNHQSRSKQS